MISEIDVWSQLGCSDHSEIRFNLEWEVNYNNPVLVHEFRRDKYEDLRRYHEEVNWESLGLGLGMYLYQNFDRYRYRYRYY